LAMRLMRQLHHPHAILFEQGAHAKCFYLLLSLSFSRKEMSEP
jgi:hypothetical protein